MKKNKPYGAAAALLAGALLGGLMTAPGAHAVDFRVKGVWIAMLEYGDGGSFVRKDREGKNVQGWGRWGEDRFEAKNRVRLQLDAAVSDALSGSVYFEIGGATWGRARSGGGRPHGIDGRLRIGRLDPRALGDGAVDVVKHGGVRGRSGKNAGGNGCGKNGPLENTGDHHFASFTASPRSDSATSIRSGAAAPEAVFTASASMAASFSRQPSAVSMRARRPSSETSA